MQAAAGFGPPAIPPGGGGPGGVQETLERMQQKLERMQQKLERMDEKLDQLEQGQVQIQAEMQARQANDQRRRHNRVAQREHPRYADPLVPLVKEQPPPAGAAGAAAVGALPPTNIFPQTWADVLTVGARGGVARAVGCQLACFQAAQLTDWSRLPSLRSVQLKTAQLNELAAFYGVQFGPGGALPCAAVQLHRPRQHAQRRASSLANRVLRHLGPIVVCPFSRLET